MFMSRASGPDHALRVCLALPKHALLSECSRRAFSKPSGNGVARRLLVPGVGVNVVNSSLTYTGLIAKLKDGIPTGRSAEPADITEAIIFLSNDPQPDRSNQT
ncbi:hypothetical protein QE379_001742 [Sphingomonas sp. SORGH_AS 879]|nr:hypothetical protein [Sphingomonas sp. SORGH_AS_0879]